MSYWALNEVNDLLKRSRDRAKRVFHGATGWQFLTREGMTMGPFDSRGDAEMALREHFEDTTTVPGLRESRQLAGQS